MTPERLLAHFDRISEAPDAISQLRRFVRDLAVRGKLVDQDPSEPCAENLRAFVGTSPEVPHSWASRKVGELLNFEYGDGLPKSRRLDKGPVNVFGSNGIVGYTTKPLTDSPAIIVGRKGSAGALNLSLGPSWTTDVAYFVVPPSFFDVRYLFVAIHSLDLPSLSKGVKPGLSRSDAYELTLHVPPLAEQRRIVAKVDELMALCDQLEAAQAERERRRDRLAAASLARLNQPAADRTEFQRHVRFHLDHLPRLTTRPNQIPAIRQTILNLAVRGCLTIQEPTDESVISLMLKVRGETNRSESASARNITRPFKIPQTWNWTMLGEIILFGPQNGISPRPTSRADAPLAITLSATTKGSFDETHTKRVEASIPKDSEFWLKPNDLLFQRGNTREYVGMAALYTGEAGRLLYPDLMIKVRLSTHVSSRFIHLVSICPDSRRFFSANASGAQASMPKINQTILRSLPIPLPPITEQHRIVAKVDELMTICNELESHLTTAETDGRRLLEAVLYEALRTAANRKAIAGVIASQPSIGVAPKKPQTFHSTSAGST